ncbi:AGAP003526-PA-like protein [Anopheles sinensis]|uniref:AGAP003526-PA-like protein n=1 Tax=Anopheles sinensis TaxID=74873 RepID=A0A084VSC6_ANOSI|nr:AGAP003526-PA-like protein [Anopheles sinensis]
MDTPAVSLFNDVGSIHLNRTGHDQQRAEEEEDLLDQERRKAELANELVGAFDDLHCDDNDTLNSLNYRSNYSDEPDGEDDDAADDGRSSERPPAPPMPSLPSPKRAFQPGEDLSGNVRELRLLLESKSRELEHVAREMYEKKHVHEQEVNALKKKLALEEAAKDRAIMTRDQTKELLVQSKTKISELEDTNEKLRGKVSALEDRNVALVKELEQKTMMLQDSLTRYRILEQNTTQKADRHTDALLKQTEERHNAKIAMMQQQINNLQSALDERQQEFRRLEARYGELQKSREALLIEKSDTVQQLQDQLEDSQRQCNNLLSKTKYQGDFEQERLRLRSRINALEQEHSGMRHTINDLTNRLEKTTNELDLMDSLVHGQHKDVEHGDTPMGKTYQHTNADATGYNFAHRNLIGSTPNNARGGVTDGDNRVVRLKNELLVCMTGQKEKRETIRKLEEELQAKDRELEQLKKDESQALVQMNQYKEEAFRLTSKCKILEQEMEKMSPGDRSRSTVGEGRRLSIDQRQEALEDKIFNLQQSKLQADERIEQLERETEQLSEKCRTLTTEVNSCAALKLEVEKQKFLLKDAQSECDRLKRLYIEISGAKDELSRELATLRAQDSAKQIAALQEQVVSLERALQLAELKSNELAKMLDKEKTSHEELLKQLQSTDKGAGDGPRQHHTPDRVGKNIANTCTKCIDGLSQIAKLEIENLKMQSTCTSQLREINELKMQLNDHQATIGELHNRLDLKAERDQLIDELKEKAAQFEQIIRSQISTNSSSSATCDSATSPHRKVSSRDQSVGTSDDDDEGHRMERRRASSVDGDAETRRLAREQEQKVREEMARAFAVQIKQIEERFRAQFVRFEENIDTLKHEQYERMAELKVRTQEVEVLKCAIVTEREKLGELLAQKDADARALFDKQSELMGKYKAEVANGQKKVQFLERELQEKRELVANERQSMEKLIAQITAERTMYREREQEMTEKFREIETEYQKSLDLVTEKYQSAKKTALNYKKYAEDKEQHMLKEYDRIKEGYNAALVKVQNRMKEALESKERNLREQLAKLEADYETKLQLVKQRGS